MADRDAGSVVWFLAGAAVGAALALLFAPVSGRETRRYITRKAEKSYDALADMGQDVVEKGRDIYDKGKKVADEAADLFDRGKKLVTG